MSDYIRINNRKIKKSSVIYRTINAINKLGPVLAPVLAPKKIDISNIQLNITALSARFDRFKILHISDIHPGAFTRYDYLKAVVSMANTLNPDIVVITGDFSDIDINEFTWSAELLATLQNKYGIYGVLGNHDMWNQPEKIVSTLADKGITILRNTAIPLQIQGETIYLVGVDDWKMGSPDLDTAMKSVPKDAKTILLSHNPDIISKKGSHNIDLVLAGHIHGGQWRFPLIGYPRIPSMYGLKHFVGLTYADKTRIYTNKGIGSTFIPFRINCPPEIALMTLRAR